MSLPFDISVPGNLEISLSGLQAIQFSVFMLQSLTSYPLTHFASIDLAVTEIVITAITNTVPSPHPYPH